MSKLMLTGIDLNAQRAVNAADPSSATDLTTKQYVDNIAAGLDWKDNVRVASTANLAVASAVVNGASVDGVTLATGDRILLKNQSTASENGIYVVVASGAASRSTDADSSADIKNMITRVSEGTTLGDTMWQLITDNPTLGSTSLTFAQFTGGGGTYTADGQGIEVSSNQFSLELDGTTLSKSASGVRIGSGAAGAGLTEASGVLAVGAGTGISVAADAVSVDTSIVARKFAADCVATTNPQTFTHSLGTKDVVVTVRRASDDVLVEADVTATSTSAISVNFGGAPTSAQYRVIVLA